jgi:hypothetical protein
MRQILLILAVVLAGGCATSGDPALMKSIAGTYNHDEIKMVFLENATVEAYQYGKRGPAAYSWKARNGEVTVTVQSKVQRGLKYYYRIEPNGDLTYTAAKYLGIRTNFPESEQITLKKKQP